METPKKQNWMEMKNDSKSLAVQVGIFCFVRLHYWKDMSLKRTLKNIFWFSKANKLPLCGETKKGGITRNTAQTQSSKEKSIMGEFPEKNELHLSHRWHAMWERQKEMGRVREMQTDPGRYIGRDVRDVGGETEEQWRGGAIIGWKRMREGWSFYFWAEHSSQAEFILVGSPSLSPRSLCLYFLHPARATELIPLKSQTGSPTQIVLY